MGDVKTASGAANQSTGQALLFELEHVAMGGRELTFEAMRSALKSARVDLTEPLFARYCLDLLPAQGAAAVFKALGKGPVPAEVQERLKASLEAAFSDRALRLDSRCAAMVDAASKLSIKLGAVSLLSAPLAESLARTLDLESKGVVVVSAVREHGRLFGGDHWMLTARRVGVPAGRCLAVCTQAASCRAAMMARMHCVAIVDRFTSFQDYGGADHVADVLDPKVIAEMLAADEAAHAS